MDNKENQTNEASNKEKETKKHTYYWSNQRMEAIAAAIERTKNDTSLTREEREARLRDYRDAMRSVNPI